MMTAPTATTASATTPTATHNRPLDFLEAGSAGAAGAADSAGSREVASALDASSSTNGFCSGAAVTGITAYITCGCTTCGIDVDSSDDEARGAANSAAIARRRFTTSTADCG